MLRKTFRAFGLIEFGFVLLMSGMILGAFLKLSKHYRDHLQELLLKERIERISKSLAMYVLKNDRLPYAADETGLGVHKKLIGIIPYAELNLDPQEGQSPLSPTFILYYPSDILCETGKQDDGAYDFEQDTTFLNCPLNHNRLSYQGFRNTNQDGLAFCLVARQQKTDEPDNIPALTQLSSGDRVFCKSRNNFWAVYVKESSQTY